MTKFNRGYTLIEMMVVISIISLLAAAGMGSYQTSLKRGKDAQRKTDLQQIRSALEIWRADQTTYPLGNATYQIVACCSGCITVAFCSWGSKWDFGNPASTYMEKLPVDPKSVDYRYSLNGSTYTLEACLENGNDPQKVAAPALFGAGTCASGAVFQLKNP